MKFFRVINSLLVGSFLLSMPTLVCAATPEHLIQLALESHPDVQASRGLRDAAERDIASARWQFYPTVSGSVTGVSTSNNDRSFLGDDYVDYVGIVHRLWIGGSLTSNLDVAKAGLQQSGAEIDQAEQELALRVLGIYVDWYSANLWVKSWQQSRITHQAFLGQVQRRTSGGASSESDTALAEARVASRFGAGLSRRSDASAARLRRDAALASVESQRQTLALNIDTDLALKASIEQKLLALAGAQRTNQAVYASFERQFLSGSRTWLDLLNSARQLTQLALRIADVRASEILESWRLSILSRGLNSVLGGNQ
jgi:outer membrane protein TolC